VKKGGRWGCGAKTWEGKLVINYNLETRVKEKKKRRKINVTHSFGAGRIKKQSG